MDEITGDAVADLMQRMRDEGYASGTINRVLILIRFIFNLARKWKIAGVKEKPDLRAEYGAGRSARSLPLA